MKTKDSIQVIGKLESRPLIKILKGGNKMASFKILSRLSTRENGRVNTDAKYYNVLAFNDIAEVIETKIQDQTEFIIKGRLISKSDRQRTHKSMKISEIMAESLLYKKIINSIEENKTRGQRA